MCMCILCVPTCIEIMFEWIESNCVNVNYVCIDCIHINWTLLDLIKYSDTQTLELVQKIS